MGYLDNTTVTVDAILTNKGREVLAATGKLDITKFALSDDEINYDLWNPEHPLGSNYYGYVIENMPLVEALPDESQLLRYKLMTLPKNTTGIPYMIITPSSVNFALSGQRVPIAPTTKNSEDDKTAGYTAIIANGNVVDIAVTTPIAGATAINPLDYGISSVGTSKTVVGLEFMIQPIKLTTAANTTLTIIGNATGVISTISITNGVLIERTA